MGSLHSFFFKWQPWPHLELEGDAEDGDDDVGRRQVTDVQVDDGPHAAAGACAQKKEEKKNAQKMRKKCAEKVA